MPVAEGYLNKLASEIFANACEKGFYENCKGANIGERIALIHSEASEALEADSKGAVVKFNLSILDSVKEEDFKTVFEYNVKNTFEDEMADIIIRVLDMCAFKDIDIDTHIKLKMKYNSTREKYHGKKY